MLKPVKLGLLCSDGGKSKICFVTVLVQLCFIDYFSDALSIDGVLANKGSVVRNDGDEDDEIEILKM
ncbi:hypothetical protein Peur_063631 [Populus x canadensis]